MAGTPTANLHLIVGEDEYLVEMTAKKLRDAAVPAELRAGAVEIIDGAANAQEEQLSRLRECIASVETPPFLDPVKLTWWRNVTFLPGGGRNGAIAERVKTALETFARNLAAHPLPANQHLIITAPKLLKTSVFARTMKTIAEVVEFSGGGKAKERFQNALANLPELAKEEGLSFAPGADEAFVSKVGTDTRTIMSELSKMRSFLGDESNTITYEAIDAISSPGGEEPELWTFTDAVGRRDLAAVARFLKQFAGMKGSGIILTTVLEKYFRELSVYRDAIDRGFLTIHGINRANSAETNAVLSDAGIDSSVKPFILIKNANAARNYTARELRVARHRMMKARERLVSASENDSVVGFELMRIVPRPRR